jgi:ATP-binding cassette subfamily B protein
MRGLATPGDVVLAFNLAAQVNAQLQGAVMQATWMMRVLKVVGRYLWLVDYAGRAQHAARPRAAVPSRIERGIDMENVSFTYAGTESPVLENVSVRIPAGTTVAIVGDNGAGKSTLVKLLCRFYEPTTGRIVMDGTDLADLDPAEWRGRIAAGFQDFVRFELLARESIGVGDLPRIGDRRVIEDAVERGAARDVVEDLSAGLDTPLGKSFVDGAELSGGQWQKVALARAMMRERPLLLMLDEPTSALDAQAEHELFDRYAASARAVARATGGIAVFVSHRFSTVRMADLIAVVDGGRIVEQGTHDALVAYRGVYADLFALQAAAYG